MIDYHSTHMVGYVPTNRRAYINIEHLQILKGRKWDEIALAYVHALRPSSIRVTQGEVKCDSRLWRVTVFVDEHDIIKEITQEVEVAPPEWVQHGMHLMQILEKDKNNG